VIQRRGFLTGITALLAAPAIIRTPGLLMPVRVWERQPRLTATDILGMQRVNDDAFRAALSAVLDVHFQTVMDIFFMRLDGA
jgi:hypothetical protein